MILLEPAMGGRESNPRQVQLGLRSVHSPSCVAGLPDVHGSHVHDVSAEAPCAVFHSPLPGKRYAQAANRSPQSGQLVREHLRIGWSKVSADVTQGEPHVSSRGEAINSDRGACLDKKPGKARVEVKANRSRVSHRYADHGPRIRERVVAVAEEPVEQYADGEQVGGDVPAIQAGVGWLIRRRA